MDVVILVYLFQNDDLIRSKWDNEPQVPGQENRSHHEEDWNHFGNFFCQAKQNFNKYQCFIRLLVAQLLYDYKGLTVRPARNVLFYDKP